MDPLRKLKHPKDSRPPGMSPDTLIHVGDQRVEKLSIRVVDYDSSSVREMNTEHAAECLAFEGKDSPSWIMVTGLHEAEKLQELLTHYDVHPLIQQDILNTGHQPKVDDFGDYLFVTTRIVSLTADGNGLDTQNFSMILTNRVLLTFQEAPTQVFNPVLDRLREGKGRLRKGGPDYLLWALLDAIMDNYLLVLDFLEERVETVEAKIVDTKDDDVAMGDIHHLRLLANAVYRSLRPMREVCIALQRSESELIPDSIQPFIRDLYDHAWHAIETADHLRESITAIREFFQADLAQRMNEVMKVLAAISTIFLPLTFIAGVYGMNFENQPEFKWQWGYTMIWGVFIVLALLMLWYFRRRRWL
jgi:magnesium transporter